MKAIGIKMADLQPMTAREANDKGYRIGEHSFDAEKLGTKTTIVSIRTLTGFESHGLSSCVDPSCYDMNIGKQFAKEKAVDAIWAGLSFVLQWAKFGLNKK